MSSRYFSTLNYTLANEDTTFELALLKEGCDTVLTIAGSGGRALPLLARKPKRMICVDLSEQQLFLTELRFALAREATHDDFLTFFGYPQWGAAPKKGEAQKLRQKWLDRLELRSPSRDYLKGWMQSLNWDTPLYDGRWERTFIRLSKLNQWALGDAGRRLFDCKTQEEQEEYLLRYFPKFKWECVIALLGNASVFNALLYKGSFPQKNIPGSRTAFYRGRYERLFRNSLARENFFLQLTFLGSLLYPEGNPIECDPEVFNSVQEALVRTEVTFEKEDAVSIASRQCETIDFLSFSDVPSYFSGELERTFLQRIQPGLRKGARVVVRNYLHIPERCDQRGFSLINSDHQELILSEKVGVYDIDLFEFHPSGELRKGVHS